MAQVVEFHTQVTDMASLMTHADLAIGAAGTSSWERCCLGLPSLVVVMADNQRMVAAELENAGAAIVLGWHEIVNAANIADRIAELMPNPERLLAMSVNTAAICDGHGAARIVAQLDPPRARDGEPVSLRPMNAADGDLLLGWQSHPMTRRYFNNPCIPTPLEHRRWLAHRLRSETCLLNLIMHGNRPAGMVRLDRKPGESTHEIFEVSILIDPGAHGQGLGSAALELIRLLIPDAVFEARVNPENTASIALFLSAGYVQQGDLFICEPRFA
jgi:RimJ/RimL family protein N-acetyltransferase